jgi:hypothetical protein
LALWLSGFLYLLVGWLLEALFEDYARIVAKVLYKIGATIILVPLIYGHYMLILYLISHRIDIVFFFREIERFLSWGSS